MKFPCTCAPKGIIISMEVSYDLNLKNYIQMKIDHIKFLSLFIALTLLLGCDDKFVSPTSPSGQTVMGLLDADANFDLVTAALKKTGLSSPLDSINSGAFTLFAPNDAAFILYMQNTYSPALAPDELAVLTLLAGLTNTSPTLDLPTLTSRLNYHLISSKITSADITGTQTFTTINNGRLSLSVVNPDILINTGNPNRNGNNSRGGKVIRKDAVDAANGVVHEIDNVLNPISTSLTTNSVLSDVGITIDYSFAPPQVTAGTNGTYNILSEIVVKSGLHFTIQPNTTPLPDWTLFTTNDAAFVTYYNSLPNPTLTTEPLIIAYVKNTMTPSAAADIVNYHLINKRIYTTDMTNGQVIPTMLAGKSVGVSYVNPDYFITDNNNAADPMITSSDRMKHNGVVHRIDGVLLPN